MSPAFTDCWLAAARFSISACGAARSRNAIGAHLLIGSALANPFEVMAGAIGARTFFAPRPDYNPGTNKP